MNKDALIHWLLQADNPPVRLLTLTHLLHRPEMDVAVQDARSRLMDYAVTQGILAHGEQFWQDDKQVYRKYTGKYWQVIFLGQFLADGQEPHIADGVHDLLEHRKWVIKDGWQCLTANLLTAFRRLGYSTHPVVQEETESLAERILADRGIKCGGMSYSLLSHCYMALPKLLFCFGEIPAEERSPVVKDAIVLISQILIAHQVFIYVPGNRKAWQKVLERAPKHADLPSGELVRDWIANRRTQFLAEHGLGERGPKRGWSQFGFPLNYNSDILEAMLALAAVGTPMTEELEKPLQVIHDQRTADGVWLLDKTYNGKMWVDVEVKGKPSKWLTLFALIVLDHFEKSDHKNI
ncbi:MAG: hypothetical protein JXA33_15405 [Anaerolineae bacterium]|nr:hypothetical protein [Anaerolineae bacterium]